MDFNVKINLVKKNYRDQRISAIQRIFCQEEKRDKNKKC